MAVLIALIPKSQSPNSHSEKSISKDTCMAPSSYKCACARWFS